MTDTTAVADALLTDVVPVLPVLSTIAIAETAETEIVVLCARCPATTTADVLDVDVVPLRSLLTTCVPVAVTDDAYDRSTLPEANLWTVVVVGRTIVLAAHGDEAETVH